jgi:hypothetical protein
VPSVPAPWWSSSRPRGLFRRRFRTGFYPPPPQSSQQVNGEDHEENNGRRKGADRSEGREAHEGQYQHAEQARSNYRKYAPGVEAPHSSPRKKPADRRLATLRLGTVLATPGAANLSTWAATS